MSWKFIPPNNWYRSGASYTWDTLTDGTTILRKYIQDGYLYIDKTLTATGFAGTENTDWECVKSIFIDTPTHYFATRYPSDLILTVIDSDSIQLDWTNNGIQDYDEISIERSTDNITYTESTTTTAGDTSELITGLTEGTLYYFRLRYRRGDIYSAYSNEEYDATAPDVLFDGDTVFWGKDNKGLTKSSSFDGTVGLVGTAASGITKLNGAIITEWASDLDSNEKFIQNTTSKKPVWTSKGISASIDHEFSYTKNINQPHEIIIYLNDFRSGVWANYNSYFVSLNANQASIRIISNVTPYFEILGGTAWGTKNNKPEKYIDYILDCLYSGANSRTYIDGVESTDNLNIGTGSITGYNLFRTINIATIKELIIRKAALSEGDRTAVNTYLTNRNKAVHQDFQFDNGKLLIQFDNTDPFAGTGTITNGYRILQEKGVKGTFFVITSHVGTANGVSWDYMKDMLANDMDLQDHSYSHPDFTGLSEANLRLQFTNVDTEWENNGLDKPTIIGYPFGIANDLVKSVSSEYRLMGRGCADYLAVKKYKINYKDLDMFYQNVFIAENITEENWLLFKSYMLLTKETKGVIIMVNHGCPDDSSPLGYWCASALEEMIDYANTIGLDIITHSELYDLMT